VAAQPKPHRAGAGTGSDDILEVVGSEEQYVLWSLLSSLLWSLLSSLLPSLLTSARRRYVVALKPLQFNEAERLAKTIDKQISQHIAKEGRASLPRRLLPARLLQCAPTPVRSPARTAARRSPSWLLVLLLVLPLLLTSRLLAAGMGFLVCGSMVLDSRSLTTLALAIGGGAVTLITTMLALADDAPAFSSSNATATCALSAYEFTSSLNLELESGRANLATRVVTCPLWCRRRRALRTSGSALMLTQLLV